MVANYNNVKVGEIPKTLGDWVKDFRLKKMQMKRKLRSGGNLRICAILSTALISAELELRRKQQERFQKWIEFQTKINKNYDLQPKSELHHHLPIQRHQQSEELVLVSSHHNEEQNWKQSEEITNLWKCELSELDNFMRSISSSSDSKSNYQSTEQRDISYPKNTQATAIRVSS